MDSENVENSSLRLSDLRLSTIVPALHFNAARLSASSFADSAFASRPTPCCLESTYCHHGKEEVTCSDCHGTPYHPWLSSEILYLPETCHVRLDEQAVRNSISNIFSIDDGERISLASDISLIMILFAHT